MGKPSLVQVLTVTEQQLCFFFETGYPVAQAVLSILLFHLLSPWTKRVHHHALESSWGARARTQGFVVAKQAFNQLSHIQLHQTVTVSGN